MTNALEMTSQTRSSLQLSPAQAAETLLERRRARANFTDYCRFIAPEEPPARHHELLCEKLQEIVDGTIKNLMVFMPPGSAKSTYGSVRFPTYYLGKFPKNDLIQASNTADLASRFGRKARNTIDSKRHNALFGVRLAKDSQAKNQWEVVLEDEEDEAGGEYFAIGVEGTVTGRRADGGLIDDPVKGREDADSQRVRDKLWDWYLTDFMTRIKPNGFQIIIQTRWHEDDLSGRILPDDWNGESGYVTGFDGAEWYVLCIPAEARAGDMLGRAPGELLWPEWFDDAYWTRIRKAQPPREWSALYQQIPAPEEGTYFKRNDIPRHTLDEVPTQLHKYVTTDFAVTGEDEANDPDYTVFGTWGLDHNRKWWLIDVYREQSQSSVWVDVLTSWIKRKKPLKVFGEAGVIRRAIEPWLKRSMKDSSAYSSVEWIPRTKDKVAMAAAFRGMCEQGQVSIPLTEWGEEVVSELLVFPAGAHDDQVDMCTLLGLAVSRGIAATLPEPEPELENDGYVSMTGEMESFKVA